MQAVRILIAFSTFDLLASMIGFYRILRVLFHKKNSSFVIPYASKISFDILANESQYVLGAIKFCEDLCNRFLNL